MFVLLHEHKDGKTRRHPVEKLPAIIGRLDSSDIRIPDQSVSREHVRLFEREGQLHAADLNSSNGTFINGKRVTLSPLEGGDVIRVGAAKLRLVVEQEDPDGGGKAAPPREEASKAAPPPEIDEFSLPGEEGDAAGREGAKKPESPRSGIPAASATETRIHGQGVPGLEKAPMTPSQQAGGGEIRVKQDILQFHRIDPRKGRTVLGDDFSQYGGRSKLLIFLLLAALAVGGFFFFRWLGETVTPDKVGVSDGVRSVEDGLEDDGGLDEDGP